MDFAELTLYAVLLLYLVGSGSHICGILTRKERPRVIGGALSGAGVALHALSLGLALWRNPSAALASGEFYLSLFALVLLLVLFFLWVRLNLSFLGLIATPLAFFTLLGSQAVTAARVPLPSSLAGLFFGLHIATLYCSLGLMAMAAAAGAAYIKLERRIKTKEKLTGLWAALPSLDKLDAANRLAVVWGFPLYSVGLFSGFLWAGITWKKFFSWDPKEIAAIFIWLLFVFLFHQRLALGWRGRKTAWLAIWVFALCIASMLGINFLVKTHHSFA
uniref:Cytochrome C assembly protein n=1 Tax=Fundidesulfovibrio putealis TaxID=270496 RepID=A0A7C4AFS6_9BACT